MNLRRRQISKRRGAMMVLVAVMLVVFVICASFSVDLSVVRVAQHQLQSSADSAAIAATGRLMEIKLPRSYSQNQVVTKAQDFSRQNNVLGRSINLDQGSGQSPSQDVAIGRFEIPFCPSNELRIEKDLEHNAVRVRAEKSTRINGAIPTFFARVFGRQSMSLKAEATAAFVDSFRGFYATPDEPAMVLPMVLQVDSWEQHLIDAASGNTPDELAFDPDSGEVSEGSDGIGEVTIFPEKTGAGGNFGTVDIGSNNNNTGTITRQIREGLTANDLKFHGNELALNDSGYLFLSGDPGGKIGPIQAAISSIIGQARILPLYESVSSNGQNAQFKIVGFVGIRVMESNLKGNEKRISVQPAPVVVHNGVIDSSGAGDSIYIYSPVRLVR